MSSKSLYDGLQQTTLSRDPQVGPHNSYSLRTSALPMVIQTHESKHTYEVSSIIGRGAFATAYIVHEDDDEDYDCEYHFRDFAAGGGSRPPKQKVMKLFRINTKYHKYALREIALYKKINNTCPNLIFFHEAFKLADTVGMVFDYGGINMYEYMEQQYNNGRFIGLDVLNAAAHSMNDGLRFLHSRGIIHGDLKPENLVIDVKKQIKIIDLGSHVEVKNTRKRDGFYIQTRYYRAPNCIMGAYIDTNIDYWSMGCILFELVVGQPLFQRKTELEVFKKQLRFIEIPEYVINMRTPFITSHYDFIQSRWRIAPAETQSVVEYLRQTMEFYAKKYPNLSPKPTGGKAKIGGAKEDTLSALVPDLTNLTSITEPRYKEPSMVFYTAAEMAEIMNPEFGIASLIDECISNYFSHDSISVNI
jgi:serine/threonine protein kinase